MKITFICTKREQDVDSYIYHVGVKAVSQDFNIQRTAGNLSLRSIDPLHFKPGKEYTIHISDMLSIVDFKLPNKN